MHVTTPIRYLSAITNHIEKYFGADFFVLHEEKSSTVHLDIHVVPPTTIQSRRIVITAPPRLPIQEHGVDGEKYWKRAPRAAIAGTGVVATSGAGSAGWKTSP
jgi:hypothetical protein